MATTHETLIKELNKDLEWEYAAAIQYLQHSTVMRGAQYESLQKELTLHFQEEMQHALLLAQQISFLGGVPSVDVEQREISSSTREMLEQDLTGESKAISRYKERIAQAEALQEYGLRRTLEDILLQEEEHKRDLISALEVG